MSTHKCEIGSKQKKKLEFSLMNIKYGTEILFFTYDKFVIQK